MSYNDLNENIGTILYPVDYQIDQNLYIFIYLHTYFYFITFKNIKNIISI